MTHLSEAILRETNGISLITHDPLIVQSLRERVDFFVLDCAARNCDLSVVTNLLYAAGDTSFLVRPASVERTALQALLNIGIDGLILPDIHYAAEAEKAIAACLYPPEGIRPYRPVAVQDKPALQAVNDQITFVVEIAHPQTIAQLDEIAEVTGINGLLVNPQRLSIAMEKGGDVLHPEVIDALKTIARVAQSYELPWGLEGENVFGVSPDFTIPTRDLDILLSGMKAEMPVEEDEDSDFGPVLFAARRE